MFEETESSFHSLIRFVKSWNYADYCPDSKDNIITITIHHHIVMYWLKYFFFISYLFKFINTDGIEHALTNILVFNFAFKLRF